MIRIVAVLDAARAGYTGDLSNPFVPADPHRDLAPVLAATYAGSNVAGGRSSWNLPTSRSRNRRYVLTRDADFDVHGELVQICNDAAELIERFESSNDELVIVGGLSLFRLFTPHATQLDIVELHKPVGSGAIYDEWDTGEFELTFQRTHFGFDQLAYRRKHSLALNHWFSD